MKIHKTRWILKRKEQHASNLSKGVAQRDEKRIMFSWKSIKRDELTTNLCCVGAWLHSLAGRRKRCFILSNVYEETSAQVRSGTGSCCWKHCKIDSHRETSQVYCRMQYSLWCEMQLVWCTRVCTRGGFCLDESLAKAFAGTSKAKRWTECC